jgi:hypothetical protein
MGQENVEQLIRKLINKVQPYGWTPSSFNEIKKLPRQTDTAVLSNYISSRLHTNTGNPIPNKEEYIILIILWNLLQKGDTQTLSALIHRHLRDRLSGQDVNFGVHALLDDHIPLPRSLVYDITERLLLNIEVMYAKIVNDFRKVPAQNTDNVILYLTLHYCRKDLNTQNKEMIGLILAHIHGEVPTELLEDVKDFLTKTFLQEIQISGHQVQIDKDLYSELNRRSQEVKEKKQEQPVKSREVKSPWEQMKNDMAKSSSTRGAATEKRSNDHIIGNRQSSAPENRSEPPSNTPEPTTQSSSTTSPSSEEEGGEQQESSDDSELYDHSQEESPDTIPENENASHSSSETEEQQQESDKKKASGSQEEREPVSRTLSEMEERNLRQDESSSAASESTLSQQAEQTVESPGEFIPADESFTNDQEEDGSPGDSTFHFTYETPSNDVEGIYLKKLDYQAITSNKSGAETSEESFATEPAPEEEDKEEEAAETPEDISEEMPEEPPEQSLEEAVPGAAGGESPGAWSEHQKTEPESEKEKTPETDERREIEYPEKGQQDVYEQRRKAKARLLIGVAVLLLTGASAILYLSSSSEPQQGVDTSPSEQTAPQGQETEAAESAAEPVTGEPAASEGQPVGNEPEAADVESPVPANAERLELSSGGESFTFYLKDNRVLWQPTEGDHFYKLFTFLEGYQGSGPQSVIGIGNLAWLDFLELLRDLNPDIGQLDLIYPDGVYAINRR